MAHIQNILVVLGAVDMCHLLLKQAYRNHHHLWVQIYKNSWRTKLLNISTSIPESSSKSSRVSLGVSSWLDSSKKKSSLNWSSKCSSVLPSLFLESRLRKSPPPWIRCCLKRPVLPSIYILDSKTWATHNLFW